MCKFTIGAVTAIVLYLSLTVHLGWTQGQSDNTPANSDRCVCVPIDQCIVNEFNLGVIDIRAGGGGSSQCNSNVKNVICCPSIFITAQSADRNSSGHSLASNQTNKSGELSSNVTNVTPLYPSLGQQNTNNVQQAQANADSVFESLLFDDEKIFDDWVELDFSISPQNAIVPLAPPPAVNVAPELSLSERGCGRTNNLSRYTEQLVDKTIEAEFGEHPWTVLILRISDNTIIEGGSLIHSRIVMTGYKNLRAVTVTDMKVRAGEWDLSSTGELYPYQERHVNVMAHPQPFHPAYYSNDLALLYLQGPFELDQHINVVCLPPMNVEPTSTTCTMTGWTKLTGNMARGVDNTEIGGNVIMKRIDMAIVSREQCQQRLRKTTLPNNYVLHHTFMCAGGELGKPDVCTGDGGYPLICLQGTGTEARYYQYGIVSWGIGCHNGNPGVYSRVAVFRRWIDSILNDWNATVETY